MEKQLGSNKQKNLLKFQVFFVVIVTILGILLGNSLYLDGYTAETMEQGVSCVYGSYGYNQTEAAFEYTGVEDSYVQLVCRNTDTDQLMFSFVEPAETDINFLVYYVDENGYYGEKYAQGTWRKGKYTAVVDVEPGTYSSYLLNLKTSFTLFDLHYATQNGKNSSMRYVIWGIGLVLGLVMAYIVKKSKPVYDVVEKIFNKICAFWSCIISNKKRVLYFFVEYLIISILLILGLRMGLSLELFQISKKVWYVWFTLSILLAVYVSLGKRFLKNIEIIGFLTVLIVGSMFAVVEPPCVGVSWDDEVHYQKALSLSHLLDKQMSAADAQVLKSYQSVALYKSFYDSEEQRRMLAIENDLMDANYYTDCEDWSGWNVRIAYLPSAIGLLLARGMGCSYYQMIIMGRWMNVLMFAILVYCSMRALRHGKMVVLLFVLIPTVIFLSGNYTYDIWLISWLMFGLSSFFGEWQSKEKLSLRGALKIGIPLFLAVMPKLVYFPICFIAMFMPKEKFETDRAKWKYRGFIALVVILPLCLVYFQNFFGGAGQGDVRGGEAVNAASQIEFIKNNFPRAMSILGDYLKQFLNPFVEGKEYLLNQAYLGYIDADVKIVLAMIVVGAMLNREKSEVVFPWWTKIGTIVLYGAIGFITALAMYVEFTAVGAETVLGCQGRYLIPALFPLLFVCSRFPRKILSNININNSVVNVMLVLSLLYLSITGLWQGCLSLY